MKLTIRKNKMHFAIMAFPAKLNPNRSYAFYEDNCGITKAGFGAVDFPMRKRNPIAPFLIQLAKV
jgi:hypothetical protein